MLKPWENTSMNFKEPFLDVLSAFIQAENEEMRRTYNLYLLRRDRILALLESAKPFVEQEFAA